MKAESSLQKLVRSGQYRAALFLHVQDHYSSCKPDAFTFPFVLKACTKLQSAPQTKHVHSQIIKHGFGSHCHTATALIDAYAKLSLFQDACDVFDEIPSPTLPCYNAVVSGLSQNGEFEESVAFFKQLKIKGLRPNSVTISSLLAACRTGEQGSQMHATSVEAGLDFNVYVATALLTMYSNCRQLAAAERIFELLNSKKIVSYNAMLSGYLRNGAFHMAIDLFREVTQVGEERVTSSTLLTIISVCSELSALLLCKELHCYILKHGKFSDVMIGTSLMDMYAKCGSIEFANRIFTNMKDRNLISWNSMISSLILHGYIDEANRLFDQLRSEGFVPDSATWNTMISRLIEHGKVAESFELFKKMQVEGPEMVNSRSLTSLLQACPSILDLRKGKQIHAHVIKKYFGYDDEFLHTAIINMYMKCGCSLTARKIFNAVARISGDPAIWNAMISGYGRNGENHRALEIFKIMRDSRVQPNSATFLSLLSSCSHTGEVEKGLDILKMMYSDYGVYLKDEHFASVVDLLGRAGKLPEAWKLLQKLPNPSVSMYSSLLGACCHFSDDRLGELVAERISELDHQNPALRIILANGFAEKQRWSDVERLRKIFIDNKNIKKSIGRSWIAAG